MYLLGFLMHSEVSICEEHHVVIQLISVECGHCCNLLATFVSRDYINWSWGASAWSICLKFYFPCGFRVYHWQLTRYWDPCLSFNCINIEIHVYSDLGILLLCFLLSKGDVPNSTNNSASIFGACFRFCVHVVVLRIYLDLLLGGWYYVSTWRSIISSCML